MFTAFQIRILLDFSNGCLMLCDTEAPEVFCGMRREFFGVGRRPKPLARVTISARQKPETSQERSQAIRVFV